MKKGTGRAACPLLVFVPESRSLDSSRLMSVALLLRAEGQTKIFNDLLDRRIPDQYLLPPTRNVEPDSET
jgi:hypothetical protein